MGIIFDLDGTLLNTIEDIARVTNFALISNGFQPHDMESYSGMVGHGLKNLVTQALPDKTSDTEIEKVYNTLIEEYSQNPVKSTVIYPGIADLLNQIEARNIPMAILSNKLHEITVPIVSLLLNKWKFEAVFGSRKNIPKKPDPYTALEIAKTMSMPPESITVVGDSGTDIKTALACNMRPIGVSWGYRSVQDIRKAGAEIIIETPQDLVKYL